MNTESKEQIAIQAACAFDQLRELFSTIVDSRDPQRRESLAHLGRFVADAWGDPMDAFAAEVAVVEVQP